ncbi:MAG TPA: beta-propeller fold lactonase family protein, partial [bacterium]
FKSVYWLIAAAKNDTRSALFETSIAALQALNLPLAHIEEILVTAISRLLAVAGAALLLAAGAGCAPDVVSETISPLDGPRIVYAVENTGGQVNTLLLAPDGSLSVLGTVGTDAGPIGITIEPSHRYVYVACEEGGSIDQFIVNDDGTLLANGALSWGASTSYVVASPKGGLVYASDNNCCSGVSVGDFGIQSDGSLVGLSAGIYLNDNMDGIIVDPSSTHVYVQRSGDTIMRYTLAAGVLTAQATWPAGTTGNGTLSFLAMHPSGNYLYVSSGNSGTKIAQFAVDTGLTALSPATVSAGAQPTGILVDPTGSYLYAANSQSASVSQYTINVSDGTLSPMSPATVAADFSPNYMAITPNGKYLLVTNSNDTISRYAIGAGGALTQLPGFAVPGASFLQGIVIW